MSKKIRRLRPSYSSYRGKVHAPNITTKPEIYIGKNVPISSACAGHIIIVEHEVGEKSKA